MGRSVIESDLRIDGNIATTEGKIDVMGKVVGDITAVSMTIQPGGSVDGKLAADKISIEGELDGSLNCVELELSSTSKVQADVSAEALTVESGARIVGKLNVSGGR